MDFDPQKILETLAKHQVEHVIVGGVGGTLYGSPMSTDDVDIVPALSKRNLDALANALNEMNARLRSTEYPEGVQLDFTGKDLRRWIVEFSFLNLMTDFGKLDLIHRPDGFSGFQELASNSEEFELGNIELKVAALEDIIRSKQTVARDRDLEQLPTLKLLLEKRGSSVIRPGDEVMVPWQSGEARGTVIDVRGAGPAARVRVRLRPPDHDSEEELDFPSTSIRRA